MFADAMLSETGRPDFLEALKPKPPGSPPTWPGANAIKRGEAGEFPRVADDAAALITRAQECFQGLIPQDCFHAWLLDQIALTTVRLDRCGRADRRLRDLAAIRAALNWDEDRVVQAEAAGRRIAEGPRAVVADLRSTPHGCDWLIRRWALLGRAAEAGNGWTEAQVALAHDLLGTPAEGRDVEPGRLDGAEARAELARREVDGLRRRKDEVMPRDAMRRAMVESDLAVEPTAELRQLGRHESRLRGWLRWLLAQIRIDAPKRLAPTGLYPRLPESEIEGKPEAEAAPKPRAEAAATAEVPADPGAGDEAPSEEQAPLPRIAGGTRKDPKATRAAARSEARLRKRELRRA